MLSSITTLLEEAFHQRENELVELQNKLNHFLAELPQEDSEAIRASVENLYIIPYKSRLLQFMEFCFNMISQPVSSQVTHPAGVSFDFLTKAKNTDQLQRDIDNIIQDILDLRKRLREAKFRRETEQAKEGVKKNMAALRKQLEDDETAYRKIFSQYCSTPSELPEGYDCIMNSVYQQLEKKKVSLYRLPSFLDQNFIIKDHVAEVSDAIQDSGAEFVFKEKKEREENTISEASRMARRHTALPLLSRKREKNYRGHNIIVGSFETSSDGDTETAKP